MSIERAIHERWGTDHTLSVLLPAERVFTGTVPGDPAMPYAVWSRLDTTPVVRTSSGTALDDARLELAIWDASLERLERIADEVERHFERTSFDLSAGRVLLMRRIHRDERRADDGRWRATLTFMILHELPERGITSHV